MAAQKAPLRAVEAGEVPATPPRLLSLVDAVEGGDYLQILLAQRREIARSIPEEKGPAKAALHRQLSIIAKDIAAIEAREQEEGAGAVQSEDEDWDGATEDVS